MLVVLLDPYRKCDGWVGSIVAALLHVDDMLHVVATVPICLFCMPITCFLGQLRKCPVTYLEVGVQVHMYTCVWPHHESKWVISQ